MICRTNVGRQGMDAGGARHGLIIGGLVKPCDDANVNTLFCDDNAATDGSTWTNGQ